MRLSRLRSLAVAGFSLFMSLAVLAGLGQLLIPSAGAQSPPPTLTRLPVFFISPPDSALVRSYDHQGNFMGEDDFSENFGDDDPSTVEGLIIDYVTLSGINNPDGNVVVADAETGNVFAGIGLTGSSAIGFGVHGGFENDDMLFSGDIVPDNDGNVRASALARTLREILIAKPDEDRVDFYMYDVTSTTTPLRFVDSEEFDIDEGDIVIAAELATDFDLPTRDEIVIADLSARAIQVFPLDEQFNSFTVPGVTFSPGDFVTAGDVDGLGFDELVIGRSNSGVIDIYRKNSSGGFPLLASFFAGFGENDKIGIADVTGNGVDEVIVADADTGEVSIYTYNMLENPAVPNDQIFTLDTFDADFTAGSQFAVHPVRYPDYDGDGLYEHWEEDGLDVNDDGTIDLDLPGMGADPRHKDLFVELDWVAGFKPADSEIQQIIESFDLAPAGAGRVFNPDQQPGINLRIDTGNLGGGNQVSPAVPVCSLSDDFYAIKNANFDPARRLVFRYGLSAQDSCPQGGQGEHGGNDFIVNTRDGGTIMHELGHTLGLGHGGGDGENCKPNYVSVMNYDHQRGIQQATGAKIYDYSPPRAGLSRGNAPLPTLDENALDESLVLDSADPTNRFVFTNANGQKVSHPLNSPVDWNGDGDTADRNLRVNIDDQDNAGLPVRCGNDEFNVLTGHDDWSNLWLPFQNSGDAADGAVNPVTDDELTREELDELEEVLNTTDLAVDISTSRDPVTAGQGMVYSVIVENLGPNPADFAAVLVALPTAVEITSGAEDCEVAAEFEDAVILSCELGTIPAGESRTLLFDVLVDAGFVFEFGPDASLSAFAAASSEEDLFSDPDPENNLKTIETAVVAETDLEVAFLEPEGIPVDVLIGEGAELSVDAEIFNGGPSAPVDVEFALDFLASPQLEVTLDPGNPTTVSALDLEAPATLTSLLSIECVAPGAGTLELSAEVTPVDATDPELEDNVVDLELTVNCVMPVAINIQPGAFPNVIDIDNLTGAAPLAVLSTAAGEDGLPFAVDATGIDAGRTHFGKRDALFNQATPIGAPDLRGQIIAEDSFELDEVTKDGDLDALMLFGMAASGLEVTDTEACVRGVLNDAQFGEVVFFGCDSVVPPPDICVSRFTGHAFKPLGPECRDSETKFVFELQGPVNLCFDRFNGAIIHSAQPACPSGRLLVVMPEDGPRTVCAGRFDGKLRFAPNNQCVSNELPYILE